MEQWHHKQQQLEQQLADPLLYDESNKTRLKALLLEKTQIDNALEQAELEWISAEETLQLAE